MRKISVCFIFAVILLGVGTHISVAEQTPSRPQTQSVTAGVMSDGGAGAPYILPGALQYDITSQINGRAYRIFVSTPYNYQPTLAYPVLYVLDGSWIFPSANRFMRWSETRDPGIVVGIGYPTDDHGEIAQTRTFDLTPSPVSGSYTGGGGLDAFLRVIEEEVKPFVMTRYRVDSAKQSLYGHSLGGLAVLRCLFRNPESFSTYIAGSPAICWNNREVLADEEAFSTRARAGELRLKLLITSAEDEQYHGNDPQTLAADAKDGGYRMVDNASELAARLTVLNPEKITVVRTIFDGETHHSSQAANISRVVRFAFSPTMMRLAPEVLARYVGIYQTEGLIIPGITPTMTIIVRQTSDGLTGYTTGIGAFSLCAKSETEFYAEDEFIVTFERDSTGVVTGLVLPGSGTSAIKVK